MFFVFFGFVSSLLLHQIKAGNSKVPFQLLSNLIENLIFILEFSLLPLIGSLVLIIMETSNSPNYSMAFAVIVRRFQLRLVLKDLES